MKEKSSVLIIGAGASTELGDGSTFPVGGELARRIDQSLRQTLVEIRGRAWRGSTSRLTQALCEGGGPTPETIEASDKICAGLVGHASIDDLLNEWTDRPNMARVAKIAIAQIILEAETLSPLAKAKLGANATDQAVLNRIRGSWLGTLLSRYKSDIPRRNLVDALRSVAFITFNYDRTIEKAIFHWLLAVTDLDPMQASKAVNSLTIIHPHGYFGALDLLHPTNDGFGGGLSDLGVVGSLIRTYSEESAHHDELASIERLCENAKTILFLGFSYHRRNIEILFPNSMEPNGEIWGTAYNLPPKRLKEAGQFLLPRTHDVSERLVNSTCAQMIDLIVDDLE